MPFGLQPWHIIVVVAVALIVFGPKQLPEVGRGLGKALIEFRRGTKEMTDVFHEEVHRSEQSDVQILSRPRQSSLQTSAQPTALIGQAQDGIFCEHCGVTNPAGARFCNTCGNQLIFDNP